MYYYDVFFVLIFLTSPGVILNPFKESAIISAIYQMFWVWLLSLPSNGSEGLIWASRVIYWLVFFLWLYIKIKIQTAIKSL